MLPSIPTRAFSSLLLLSSIAAAVNLDCENVQVDKKKFDLSKLGGPHSILVADTYSHPAKSNTTWTIDICQALKKPKGVPKGDTCPSYTRVCGITQTWNPIDDPDVEHPIISDVIGVAGEYTLGHGGALDPKITRLKTSGRDVEGIDIELHGGRYNDRKQKALVSFFCERDWTGNEGYEEEKKRLKREEEDDDDGDDEPGSGERFKQDSKNALQFVSYTEEGEGKDRMDVLRLNWRTKYACEQYDEGDDEPTKKEAGWGFFTWFILILFLGIAAYLIFGSWLNYNRYGARGWDLLPHGDTIRDVPYLFKDWSRKVVETVTGSSSRGGYSAV
ncbi:type II membrane protein [Exophiala xenobiotica]|uniref:Autophagy-related protein 27 n=1 Tax=Lithohypha guttulata TaxID=1690604 RepID=A0ABR0K4X9_9EURO|nr:type II membrane protein [Lithohypha guttulata]KAK5314288.1 type II membrane protein [Exophiala xenobiotica]